MIQKNRPKFDFKYMICLILLIFGIGYWFYSVKVSLTERKQVDEANELLHNLKSMFIWSMHQYNNNVSLACNFENIQITAQSEEFQNMNRILNLKTSFQKTGQYIEKIEVYPSQDLKSCNFIAFFRQGDDVEKNIAGKYMIKRYDIEKEKIYCITNIQKYRLVKACQRVDEHR